MDNKTYSLAGCSDGKTHSSSHLDFINHWEVQQTVEREILQGKLLREEKPHAFRQREYDVVNVDYIKLPCSRKKSPKKHKKPYRSRLTSPERRSKSPSRIHRKTPDALRKSKKLHCSMRIAELAVPTKRQCIATWRNKYETLPAYMLERLQQHVLDQRPVLQVSDAIYCFKRKVPRKARKAIENERGNRNSRSNKKTKSLQRTIEIRTFCAIFGHKLAKNLNVPRNLTLNSDLIKIANVVSCEIANLMCKSKGLDMGNKTYMSIHNEISNKVTIWISNVLDEMSYKMLEDQWRDVEEEFGPVFHIIDDLVDNVVVIQDLLDAKTIRDGQLFNTTTFQESCEPEPEVIVEPYSSESKDISISGECKDIEVMERQDSIEKIGDDFDNVSVSSIAHDQRESKDILYELPEMQDNLSNENVEVLLRNELNNIVDSIDKNIDVSSDNYEDVKGDEDRSADMESEFADSKQFTDIPIEYTDALDQQSNAEIHNLSETFEDENKETRNEGLTEQQTDDVIEVFHEASTADHVGNEIEADQIDSNVVKMLNEETIIENLDQPINIDFTEIVPNVLVDDNENEASPEANAHVPETFQKALPDEVEEKKTENLIDQEAAVGVTEIFSEDSIDDNNKKVKFTVSNEEIFKESHDELPIIKKQLNWIPSVESIRPKLEFSAPNLNLLSESDESWPEDITAPFIRPSESVSKSITSLGKIVEEKMALESDDENDDIRKHIGERKEQDVTQSTHQEREPKNTTATDRYLNPTLKQDSLEVPTKLSKLTSDHPLLETKNHKIHGRKPTKLPKVKKDTRQLQISPEKEVMLFECKLDKVTEETAIQTAKATKLKFKTQGRKKVRKDKKMYTSETIRSIDKGIAAAQSPKDLKKIDDTDKAKDVKFSSLRVKPKPDYRVDIRTAPSWIKRSPGEPSCFASNIVSQNNIKYKMNENDIRKWSDDLVHGFDNLLIWNEWINTSNKNIELLKYRRGVCSGQSRSKDIREWMMLKKNIDDDADLWHRENKTTQKLLLNYRKYYQKNLEIERPGSKVKCCSSNLQQAKKL